MNIKINHKMIKDMCGSVSFKRGEAFYRAHQIQFKKYTSEICEATVSGVEDFYVKIEKDAHGSIFTSCSCPTLTSFQKDCQHIAAVLLAISEQQRRGTVPMMLGASPKQEIGEGIFNLFAHEPSRASGQRLHFEYRQLLQVEFICKPVYFDNKRGSLFAIQLKVDSIDVKKIRKFLSNVKEGKPYELSTLFTYNPAQHCFDKETDTVIHQLIQVMDDEKAFDISDLSTHEEKILIPPSSWEHLFPLLKRTPFVKLEYDGDTLDGLHTSNDALPLLFELVETEGKGYRLKVKGLNRLIVMNTYNIVLYEGKIVLLKGEDCHRLFELKQLLDASEENQIPVHQDQLHFFLDKVVPGLRRLGDIRIDDFLKERLKNTPLVAKLYLDRVKNRLLAGLEFHYEHLVINPLEGRKFSNGSSYLRDIEKEDKILQLIEDSKFAKTEGGYFLQNEELEYQFLYHVLPKLQKLVQVYATTAVKNRIIKGNDVRPQIRVRAKKERTNWLEFKFDMDGIPEIQIRDVLQALEEKRKYYRLRNGSLLSLETKEFNEIQRFLKAVPVQNLEQESVFRVPITRGLQLLDSVEDKDVLKLEKSFRQFLDMIYHPEKMKFEVPYRLGSILRDYQKFGFKWMKTLASFRFGGILADDMGLGKTLQSIAFILSELADIRKKKLPVLIVCPTSVTYNWVSELMTFAPEIQAIVIDGHYGQRSQLINNAKEMDVVITSYPLLRQDIKWFEKQEFHTVIFDEAQAFKNPVTQTFRTVKKINSHFRFALTGTPVENSVEELWSIFHVVFPELFQGLKEYSSLTNEQIARRIRPFLLRRVKEDVLSELPEKIETLEFVDLLPEQKKLYAAYLAKLRSDTLKHLDKDTIRKNRIKILAGLTRLRQICCHPALFMDGYTGSSAKFEQLIRIVEEAKLSRRRVLIFSQFTKMLELIGRHLAYEGRGFFYLDGQTPSEERVEMCKLFNSGERDLFLISLKAGGTGLNLTGADTVILYDIWWNPAVEAQAMDRAHRIGQTNPVQVIKLVARGTIEEKMNELQGKKRELIEEIIESEKKSLISLTEEDIREILMI